MKKIFLAIIIASICSINISVANTSLNYNDDISLIKGSGNLITKSISIENNYDAIKASRGVRVTMEMEEGDKATILADDNVMPYVQIYKEGSSLYITIDKSINALNNVTVEVTLPKNTTLNELDAASSATINIKPTIAHRSLSLDAASSSTINISKAEVEFCDVDASSAAKITGAIKSNDCFIDAASAAKITLSLLTTNCSSKASSASNITLDGETSSFIGDAASAAKIEAKSLTAHTKATAEASSGARVAITVVKALTAKASSAGVVAYSSEGAIELDMKQSSGGRVRQM